MARLIPLALLLLVVCAHASAQGTRRLTPTIGAPNHYSLADQQRWVSLLALSDAVDAGKRNYETLPARDKAGLDSLEMGYGPLTQGLECSWYCGGEMYRVTSATHLAAEGAVTYRPDNLHDFNLFTAWVPDTAGGAVGKKIAFHFKPLTARVNEIMVWNGYIKNDGLFHSNGRVKSFNLYINGRFYGLLRMSDTTAAQTFSIEPVRSDIKGKDLVLTLEIREIYPGTKYPHVAVSEINFSGLDVH